MELTHRAALARLLEREGTGISWADLTANFWIGCTKVSPACDNCYAEDLARNRLGVDWGPHADRRLTAKSTRNRPLRWNRIAEAAGVTLNVFCSSLSDVFDNAVPDSWRQFIALTIMDTPHLRWMLLTKRIGNARKMLEAMFPDGVPGNVALGVTIATQEEADRDLPKALSVKAGLGIKRLFVSAEPLLEQLNLGRYVQSIDLLIVGGESGAKARPMLTEWVRSLLAQCNAVGTRFHFKQWGEWAPVSAFRRNRTGETYRAAEISKYGVEQAHVKVGDTDNPDMVYRIGIRGIDNKLDGVEHREHFA